MPAGLEVINAQGGVVIDSRGRTLGFESKLQINLPGGYIGGRDDRIMYGKSVSRPAKYSEGFVAFNCNRFLSLDGKQKSSEEDIPGTATFYKFSEQGINYNNTDNVGIEIYDEDSTLSFSSRWAFIKVVHYAILSEHLGNPRKSSSWSFVDPLGRTLAVMCGGGTASSYAERFSPSSHVIKSWRPSIKVINNEVTIRNEDFMWRWVNTGGSLEYRATANTQPLHLMILDVTGL